MRPFFIIFLLLTIFFLLLPHAGFAEMGGIVPCGGSGQAECDLCQVFVLIKNIIGFPLGFIWRIIFPLTTLMIAAGGLLLVTSRDDETQRTRAKGMIRGAIVGFAIALVSWLIIGTLLTFLANPAAFPMGPWSEITCG